jgi:hypothetical protein
VHANRTIQELRRGGMLQWKSRTITVTDWQALAYLARFKPDYLGLRDTALVLPSQPHRLVQSAAEPELSLQH